MLGQFNAVHMGLGRGENPKQTQSQKTGLVGVEGVHTSAGFEITSVLSGSPANREESKLNVGETMTSINQQPVSTQNLYSLMIDQVDVPVLLTIQSKVQSKVQSKEKNKQNKKMDRMKLSFGLPLA